MTSINLVREPSQAFDINENFHLLTLISFEMQDLIPKLQSFQDRNWNFITQETPRL
jgi:hypothetical protein